MKSNKVLRWVALVSVGVLGACGGVSDIGSGDEPQSGKSGSTGMSTGGTQAEGATGNVGNGAQSMGAIGNRSGNDPGTGPRPGLERCMTDRDCPVYDTPCEPCADGSFACNRAYCGDGVCVNTRDTCSTKCEEDRDCPVIDIACADCGDGTTSCPTSSCQMGSCQTTFPGCGNIDPCQGLACGAMCQVTCPPGKVCDANLVSGYCSADGQCQAGVPQCGNQNMCATSKDCGPPPPICVACGNDTCATFECLQNKCVFACPPNPEPECETVKDCPPIDASCHMCKEVDQCAVQACIQGSCKLVCPVP